jgi:hypothetical protein
MRVVSFVPSWTETLIASGVEVVGCTRFCIHPENAVKSIPNVGGTKNINSIKQILDLKPDFVLFDKEENNKEMYQMCLDHELNCYATHVLDLKTCGEELIKLADILDNAQLLDWGNSYLKLKTVSREKFKNCVIEGEFKTDHVNNYSYVIWKKPFMRVSSDTFIADVLKLFEINLVPDEKKYPEISDEDLKKTFCLFSSEPFPFAKHFKQLQTEGFQGVLVDGEKLSWYGIRTLKFLQSLEES